MNPWRAAWWGKSALVDRLEALGPAHPLVARLEAGGWEGLREDLEARARVRRLIGGRPGHAVRRCPECGGRGLVEVPTPFGGLDTDECRTCRGTGWVVIEDEDWEAPCAADGVGARFRALRETMPRDQAARAAWLKLGADDDPELPF